MKIFWSWQSDTPGKIGRHFVRDALAVAIDRLRREVELAEPTERESRAAMHLDHDRKGIAGSPDLARVILEKIKQAAIFVADVTPVGVIPNPGASAADSKKTINSNVAIELGYALHALGDGALLMVMNQHYGARNDLPFDLQAKAGPLLFNLAPNADKATISAEARKLQSQLAEGLKACLVSHLTTVRQRTPFVSTHAAQSPAFYFKPGEVLASVGRPGEHEYRFEAERAAYLRLYPTYADQPPVALATLTELFQQRKVWPMSMTWPAPGSEDTELALPRAYFSFGFHF
jgi:hypothetical protein